MALQQVREGLQILHENLGITEKELFNSKICSIAKRLITVLGKIVPIYRTQNLPAQIKDKFTPYEVARFFTNIAKQSSRGGPFQEFAINLEEYNKSVLDIKAALLAQNDGKAIDWRPRNAFLFSWCRVLIEETGHPALQEADAQSKESLFDTLTSFVMPLTQADDVADYLQDKELLRFFTEAFKTSSYTAFLEKDHSAQIASLERKSPACVPFFKLYLRLFKEGMAQFEKLVGTPALSDAWPQISQAWEKVMLCLQRSVTINESLGTIQKDLDRKEEELAQNMLMSFFKVLERCYINAKGIQNSLTAQAPSESETMFAGGEMVGHAANHIATFEREIRARDFSNTIVWILADLISSQQQLTHTEFSQLCKDLEVDSGIELPDDIRTFPELLEFSRTLGDRVLTQALEIVASSTATDKKSRFEERFRTCSSHLEVATIVSDIYGDDSGNEEKIIKIQQDAQQRQAISELILRLSQNPSTNAHETYLRRFNNGVQKLSRLSNSMPKSVVEHANRYLEGVYRLAAMYMLLKTSI
ncbi:MAG: hypothetical protein AB7F28_04360 [Candidatus Margulisiibacteriota bacterium]